MVSSISIDKDMDTEIPVAVNTIDILKFNLNDFGYSEKAVWLNGRWFLPRYGAKFTKSFLNTYKIAKDTKDKFKIYIPKNYWEDYVKNSRNSEYTFNIPKPIDSKSLEYSTWREYIDENKYFKE